MTIRLITTAATFLVAFVTGLVVAEDPGVTALRKELQTIAAEPMDILFVQAYDKHLWAQGFIPIAWRGDSFSIGYDWLLDRRTASDPTWRFHSDETVYTVEKGHFVRFLTANGFQEEVPAAAELASATMVMGTGQDSLAIVYGFSGRVSVLGDLDR